MSRCALFSLGLVLLTVAATSAEPPTVHSSAQPAAGIVTVQLRELWRAGVDDDAVFFGNIGTIKTDPNGSILVLDSQLAEVHRFDAHGEHLGVIGGEGDGPGETRRPGDMFVTDDGTICLVQGFPGRIVKLHRDGTPAGEATYNLGDGNEGQFAVMRRGLRHPEGMVLAGNRMSFGADGVSNQNYFLALCDADGRQRHRLLEKNHVINYSDFVLDEMAMDFVWFRVATGPQGRIIVAPERNAMRFDVYTSDGALERSFSRDYDSGKRTRMQRERTERIIRAVGSYYPTPPVKITIEDSQPAVINMWTTDDGRLWVQVGNPLAELPLGTWAVLDIYTQDGIFERQLALAGNHDPMRDSLFVQPDGSLAVVVGALDAWLSQQGVGGAAEEDEQATALEIVWYRLEW
jgi:hypothetical protein